MRVLIVGVSTRAAAESAARAGYDVIALDAFADLDQHPSVRALSLPRDFGMVFSPEGVVTASRDLQSGAVVYLSSLENHPKAVAALATARALWGNPSDVLRRVRDPKALAAALATRGIRAPRVIVADRAAIANRAAIADRAASLPRDHERWMLKPRVSGGGHGVHLWAGEPLTPGHYLQEFVEGTPGSVIFVAARGRGVALGITRQLVGDEAFGVSGFRYCGNIMGARHALAADARLLVDAIAEEFSLVGVGSIDVVLSADGLQAIEVNPRWSASMELVERARDISMFALHADACVNGALPTFDVTETLGRPATHGKAVVFARQDVVVGDPRAWLEDAHIRDVPHEGDHIATGQPICTVFAAAPDESSCYARLAERAERVYSDLATQRPSHPKTD